MVNAPNKYTDGTKTKQEALNLVGIGQPTSIALNYLIEKLQTGMFASKPTAASIFSLAQITNND